VRTPPKIRVLANAQDAIDVLAEFGPMNHAELAERIGLPRSSVYRLMEGLEAIGLTVTYPEARIGLGVRWLSLADEALGAMQEWSLAIPAITRLAEQSGLTSYLTIPSDLEAFCVAWAPGRGIGVLMLKPGRSLLAPSGAAGGVALAWGGLDLKRLAEAWEQAGAPRSVASLRSMQSQIREAGYALSDEDVTAGIGAIGKPVFDSAGSLRGCISVAGLADEIRSHERELAVLLAEVIASL
jgi:IclR family acetate operon transcriptional repressor